MAATLLKKINEGHDVHPSRRAVEFGTWSDVDNSFSFLYRGKESILRPTAD